MMLTIAIPTVTKLASASHKKLRRVHVTLKRNRRLVVSTAAFSNAARTQLTNQVTGLNVPQSKRGMIVMLAINSQTMPDRGMPIIPMPAETAFIASVINPDRGRVAFVSQSTKKNSITSPVPMIHHVNKRPPRYRDGHTTLAIMVMANDFPMRHPNL